MESRKIENNDYVNLLLQYPNIQKISANNRLNRAQLIQLTGNFPILTNVTLNLDQDVGVDDIIEFVKQSPSLNQLKFDYDHIENIHEFEKELKTDLGADFYIKLHDLPKSLRKQFSIDRKIPIVLETAPEELRNAAYLYNSVIYTTFVMFVIAYVARCNFL